MENYFSHKIITFYSDNGGEYLSLKDYLATTDISHLTTPPQTPEHNGYSEKCHRHIVETGLTLLTHASLPLMFWSHAFATAVFLINRMPTATLHLSSPYEIFLALLPTTQDSKFSAVCVIPGSGHTLPTN